MLICCGTIGFATNDIRTLDPYMFILFDPSFRSHCRNHCGIFSAISVSVHRFVMAILIVGEEY